MVETDEDDDSDDSDEDIEKYRRRAAAGVECVLE